jgi:hypothetical protein
LELMGDFIHINPYQIEVTQDMLNPKGVERKVKQIKSGKTLICCVAQSGDSYRLIDGHHALAANVLSGKQDVLAYVANSPRDYIQQVPNGISCDTEGINSEIRRRFNSSLFYVPTIQGKEIRTIDELIDMRYSGNMRS